MESSGSADRIPDGPPLDNRALFGLQRKGLSVHRRQGEPGRRTADLGPGSLKRSGQGQDTGQDQKRS